MKMSEELRSASLHSIVSTDFWHCGMSYFFFYVFAAALARTFIIKTFHGKILAAGQKKKLAKKECLKAAAESRYECV